MNRIKRLCKFLPITLLFMVLSVGVAFANNLKNNPINEGDSQWGEKYLTGTTFSLANDDSQTDKSYFLLSDVIFGRPLATIEMGQKYQEANGTWNSGGSITVPRFTILSNPALLESSYTEKADRVNRLIFRAPKKGETVFKINVGAYKPNSDFAFIFNIEEIAGANSSEFTVYVNGQTVTNSIFEVPSNKQKTIVVYSSDISESQLLIELKRTGDTGDDAVIAISDLYIYGEREAVSASASPLKGTLGEPVTLSAVLQEDLSTTSVKWMKKTSNETTWTELSSTELTITDLPLLGDTYYKVVLPTGEESLEVVVSRDVSCGESTSKYLFVENFGTLSSDQERMESNYVNKTDYTYVEKCKPLKNEGTYAVVANPKYGGNGDMGENGNSCNIDKDLWFCDRFDHTQGGLKNGVYGGMLMVNCSEKKGTLIYSRQVTVECQNVIMNFTAWFANASNKTDQAPIKAQFRVKDKNGNYITEAEIDVENIAVGEPWKKGVSTFYSGENDQFTVEIWNLSAGGTGNDMLVDDISFSICSPKINLTYKTAAESKREENFITGSCEEDIEITAQGEYVNSIFSNPYYLWVVRKPSETSFSISAELSGYINENAAVNVVNTQFEKQAAEYFVIVAGSKEDAEDYYEMLNNGTGVNLACSAISMSDTIAVACTPTYVEIKEGTRNCNVVDIDVKTNSKDELKWFANGELCVNNDGEIMTAKSFKVVVSNYQGPVNIKAQTSDGAESNVITIYPINISNKVIDSKGNEFALSPVPSVNYGEQIIITTNISPASDANKYPVIYKDCEGNLLQSKIGVTGYNPVVKTPICLYSEFRGCKSEEININVKTFVEIKQTSRTCNTISFKGNTNLNAENLKWYYSNDGVSYTEYSATGTSLEIEVSQEYINGMYIKAVATDNTSSSIITVYPIVISNKVYDFLMQDISVETGVVEVKEKENNVIIKTTIQGLPMSNGDLITYKSCDGNILASTSEAEFVTAITEQNKCFVTEYKGCVSENIEFSIKPQELIWPTAFNPLNQDGINDTFVKGYGIKVMIMDRYGNVVAESEDGWDGTIKGANAMPGVYFYVATLPDETVKKGTIELVHYVK